MQKPTFNNIFQIEQPHRIKIERDLNYPPKGKQNVGERSIATVTNGGIQKIKHCTQDLDCSARKVFIRGSATSKQMNEMKIGRRERRRRKFEMKTERGNHLVEKEIQKTIENVEFSIKPHVTQVSRKLVRRDSCTILHSKTDFDERNMDDVALDYDFKSGDTSENDSVESKNLTYSLNKDSEKSGNCTYSIEKSSDSADIPPVPAPRKSKSMNLEPEKVSSDTDRDITEINLDDPLVKSPKSDLSSKSSPVLGNLRNGMTAHDHGENDSVLPVPKPRKTVKKSDKSDFQIKSSTESLRSNEKTVEPILNETSATVENPSERLESNELPLIENLQDEAKSVEGEQKTKKPLDGKKKSKKSRAISSLIKLDKKKIPKIKSILKDVKEDTKESKPEMEGEKIDFQLDSPHFRESPDNGRIYVQGKNGFHVMQKDEVLKKGRETLEKDEMGGMIEDSTVKTAVLFQKYWSRFMTYFHGILAGFGFSHAATVTAIMLHFNYDPEGFIAVYSCLSLKIHYVFYTLTALCIVSCFDRIDIGHINRKHWERAWKIPSLWIVLNVYIVSFVLTFANQKTEVRFDAFQDGNRTEIWDDQTQSQIQVSLLHWYYTVWARDVLVLVGWLMIAMSNFDDFLFSHVSNMAKYAEGKEEKESFRHMIHFF